MPEQLLNEFQISSFLVDDGGRRVTEVVEPSSPAIASDPETMQRRTEHGASEHIGILDEIILYRQRKTLCGTPTKIAHRLGRRSTADAKAGRAGVLMTLNNR